MELNDTDLLQVLTTWLPQRRWFAAKGRRITGSRIASRCPIPGVRDAEHVVVAVRLDGAQWQVYQVPLMLTTEPTGDGLIGRTATGFLHDGLAHAGVVEGLLRWTGDLTRLDPAASPSHPQTQWLQRPVTGAGCRVLGVEQSNTSVVLGDELLVKFFRLLSAGVNPDIEVHAALSDIGCRDVGQLFGWINGGWTDPVSGAGMHGHLAMIQEFFPDSVDGWHLARSRVAEGAAFTSEAQELGAATARVHQALAVVFPNATLGASQIVALAQRLHSRLSAAAEIVPDIALLAPWLHQRLDRLLDLREVRVQRVHGDFHLGQVLRTRSGWRVLDFEGEPGGELQSRRVLDHPMRDVAGMLRSFAYAAWQGAGSSPEAQSWQAASSAAFLRGYAEAADIDPAAHEILLGAYTIDKAVYEAVYEQRNRPDWLGIPMSALQELARPA